jgi:ATP synthase protein I
MLSSYPLIARRAAMFTAAAGVIMVAVSAAAGGGKGAVGALLAVALVAAFFGITLLAVSLAARRSERAAMVTAGVTYLVKIVLVLFFVVRISGATVFNGRLFGLTAIVCILVWTAAQAITTMRLKMPYVEPDGKR